MTTSNTRAGLLALRLTLQRLLAHFDQGLIIGGVAASLPGKLHLTADVDAVMLVSTDDLLSLIQAAAQGDLSPRIAGAETFACRNRVLSLRHQATGIDVDISLGMLPLKWRTLRHARRQSAAPPATGRCAPRTTGWRSHTASHVSPQFAAPKASRLG